MNLALGLIVEIERMGGRDVWMLMRPNAMGVSYDRNGKTIRHSISLPFGKPSEEAMAVLLDLADQEFAN